MLQLSGYLVFEVQVLAPVGVCAADHAHDVARRVQGEWTRLAEQTHLGEFVKHLAALAAVAFLATGYEVFPAGRATARTRDDVIECEVGSGEDKLAVLAGIAVTQQDVLARKCASLVRDTAVFKEPDDAWHLDHHAVRVESAALLFFGARNAFKDEHESAPCAADVDRFVACVEDQHGRLHGRLAEDAHADVDSLSARCSWDWMRVVVPVA